jgi:hypothetical protein
MANWVDTTEQTDRGFESTGCGMAFISWVRFLGKPLDMIAQKMVRLGDSGTLAQLYEGLGLGGAATAWPTFIAAVLELSAGVTSDDPFGGILPPTLTA